MFTHTSCDLLGRQGQLVIGDERGGCCGYYFYDAATALLSKLDDRLGQAIVRTQEPDAVVLDLLLDAVKVLTVVEQNTSANRLESALKVESIHMIALGVELGCNLACAYCYNENHYQRPSSGSHANGMALGIALEAIEKALQTLGPSDRLTVQLIGGEPLLQFPMLRQLIPAAEKLAESHACAVRFGMNTNGLALTPEVVEFLIEHHVAVAISIDGTRDQNDLHRKFQSGHGSYEMLASRIKRFMERFKPVSPIRTARITVSVADFNFVEAVEHLQGMGFNSIAIGLALTDILKTVAVDGRDRMISQLIAGLTALEDYCIAQYRSKRLLRISLFNDAMFTLYASRSAYSPCGALRRYVGVSPNGDIVPCHRYIGTGKESRRYGSVCDKSTNRLALHERSQHVAGMKYITVLDDPRDDAYSCRTCWARHLCGGECYEIQDAWGEAYQSNKPYLCNLKRAIYKLGIEMLIMLAGDQDFLKELMEMNVSPKPNRDQWKVGAPV